MVILIHLALIGVCTLQCVTALPVMRREFLRFLLFAAIGLIHGVVPAISEVLYPANGYQLRWEAGAYALVGTLLLSVGWTWARWWMREEPTQDLPVAQQMLDPQLRRRFEKLFIASALLGVIAWFLKISAMGASFEELLSEQRLAYRGSGNQLLAWLFSGLMTLAYLPGFLGFFLSYRYRVAGILYALTYAAAFYLVTKGTRSMPIGIMGTVLGGYVLHRQMSIIRIVVSGTVGIALVLLLVGLYPLRHQMHSLTPRDMAEFLVASETYEDMLQRDPLNYHQSLVDVVDCFPDLHGYVHAAAYRRIFFFYLPHSRFPTLKPRDPNRVVAEVLFDADPTIDWMHPPSLFGDCYINFYGWFGIGLLVVHGAVLSWLAKLQRTWLLPGLVLGPNAVHYMMIGMRGQPYTLFIYLFTTLVFTGAVMWVLGIPLTSAKSASRRPAAAIPGLRVDRGTRTSVLQRPRGRMFERRYRRV